MKQKKYLILSLFIVCLIFVGGTLSFLQWISDSSQETEIVFTVEKNFSCSVDGKGDITNENNILMPTSTCLHQTYAIQREIKVMPKLDSNHLGVTMDLWLEINEIGKGLSESVNFNYALTTNNNSCVDGLINSGTFKGKNKGDIITLFENNIYFNSTTDTYYLYIWIDSDETNSDILKQNINLSLNGQCKSTSKFEVKPFNEHISSIYNNSDKTIVTNDSIEYNYATSILMMNDRLGGTTEDYNAGNIRYYGAVPNNYVYFNCHDYSNQSKNNCELWRIIGVFKNIDDGKGMKETRVKIIKADDIGYYTFDTTPSNINSGNGTNDWAASDLSKMLNPNNENNKDYNSSSQLITLNNSLYWNRTIGNCYVGKSNATGTCDFTNNGITERTKNFIGDAIYYLGSFGDEEKALMTGNFISFMEKFHAHEMYSYERSNNVNECSDIKNEEGICIRPTEWTGKIALIYPSDYIYATDFNICNYDGISFGWSDWSHTSAGFVTDGCYSNDWLTGDDNEWLISPHNTPEYRSFTIQTGKYIYGAYNWRPYKIRPTLYLKSNVLVKYGDGTFENPYQLIYNN